MGYNALAYVIACANVENSQSASNLIEFGATDFLPCKLENICDRVWRPHNPSFDKEETLTVRKVSKDDVEGGSNVDCPLKLLKCVKSHRTRVQFRTYSSERRTPVKSSEN